jgi:hypothetical protein
MDFAYSPLAASRPFLNPTLPDAISEHLLGEPYASQLTSILIVRRLSDGWMHRYLFASDLTARRTFSGCRHLSSQKNPTKCAIGMSTSACWATIFIAILIAI